MNKLKKKKNKRRWNKKINYCCIQKKGEKVKIIIGILVRVDLRILNLEIKIWKLANYYKLAEI